MSARLRHVSRMSQGSRIGAVKARVNLTGIPKRIGRTTVARRITRRRLSNRMGFGFKKY